MRTFWTVIGTFGLVASFTLAPASAQTSDNGRQLRANDAHRNSVFDLRPELTKDEFEQFIGELGSVLRFRQIGDTTTLGRGTVELGVQFANTPFNDSKVAWISADRRLGRSISYPQAVARFGVSDRVDVGAWGGFDPDAKYGLAGVDTKVALLRQGPEWPVSVSIRPSVTSLIWPSDIWEGTASVDLSVSRAFGRVSPYAGVAASTSLGIERSQDVDLDPATAERSLAYAGLSYRWRALILAAEVEKGARVNYAFRIGTRF